MIQDLVAKTIIIVIKFNAQTFHSCFTAFRAKDNITLITANRKKAIPIHRNQLFD
jgi:hypothetical protein